jgi:hypothetical protein
MKSMNRWLKGYIAKRESNMEPNESWTSTKYDFTDPQVRLEHVPEMGCNVGGCVSALKRSWKAYRIAKRYSSGEERYLAYRIRSIQCALGIEQSFPELEEMH